MENPKKTKKRVFKKMDFRQRGKKIEGWDGRETRILRNLPYYAGESSVKVALDKVIWVR